MATTPNYGWVTPAPTDFVTDLPADFEVFADAVDADLAGLLGGTTGQILTKDSNADHDFSWQAAPAAPNDSFTLLNAGGTALTGAATITVSGISNRQELFILFIGASSASAQSKIFFRLNSNSANYQNSGLYIASNATYVTSSIFDVAPNRTNLHELAQMANNASSTVGGWINIKGCNSTGVKIMYAGAGHAPPVSASGGFSLVNGGTWTDTATVSSFSLISETGNFDAGTLFVYGRS